MKIRNKILLFTFFILSITAQAGKYDGFNSALGGLDKIENINGIRDKYNNAMQPLRNGVNNIQSYSDMGRDYFSRTFNFRQWRRIGRLEGAVNDRMDSMRGFVNGWQGNQNFGGTGTNVFVVHITSKVIVPPLVKIAKKAINEVEKNIENAVEKSIGKAEDFQNKMINKIYDRLGVTKLEEQVNKTIDRVKQVDDKINRFILTGTDKIGEFKQDIDTLVNAGYNINDMLKDENGNLLVRIGNFYVQAKDIIKTLNKYAKVGAIEKGLKTTDMVDGFINEWDMLAESKIRDTINQSSYELGYLLKDEIIKNNDYLKNISYNTTKLGKKVVVSGVPIGASTPDMALPFERYNVDKVFLENTPVGFSDNQASSATGKKYQNDEKWHKQTTNIFVDNFKSAVTGKAKDSTEGNTIGYKKPMVAKDSVQKTAYTNAPFMFDDIDNKKNVGILQAIPRVQTEAKLRTLLEGTKIATVIKGANLIESGEAVIGERATVVGRTTTNGAYSALVIKFTPKPKVWIEYYGNSVGKFESKGKTDPVLLSRKLQNIYLKTEDNYLKVAKDSIGVLEAVYQEQMNEMGTTHLTGFEKDETKQGRTSNSNIIKKENADSVKKLLNSQNSYLLAEENRDYINKNQEKRKEKFIERAEIEKIANAVKNEHNAFRDFQNAYYNNLLFEEAVDNAYGNFKPKFFENEKAEKKLTREQRQEKNKLYAENFGTNKLEKDRIIRAKKVMDNLLRKRFIVIEQLNRNLGNQGARFKTMLDAVQYVKDSIDKSDMSKSENRERATLNLKRLYQAFAVITSQTREEISLISKNVINSKRTDEIEEMVLADIGTELLYNSAKNEYINGSANINKQNMAEVNKALKADNIDNYLLQPKN